MDNGLFKKHPELKNILLNISLTNEILENNKGPKIVGLISGSKEDQTILFNRFEKTKILGKDVKIISSLEKTRKGNFLGTLRFYKELKELDDKDIIQIYDRTVLCGMVFGKGERLYPITSVLKNIKPFLPTPKTINTFEGGLQETMIESALRYFSLVSIYLEKKGFRGILDKWGDEIQIPAVEFELSIGKNYKDVDVIKVVSEQMVNIDNAKEKDWVGYDKEYNLTMQIPRRPFEKFAELAERGIVKVDKGGNYVCGISLGPVGVSYDFLDIANEVFSDEINKEGCYFDFDPYFLMALALAEKENGRELWEKQRDLGINKLDEMMVENHYGNDFYSKIENLCKLFKVHYKRKLVMKVLDLGKLYWADIGQHKAMRETFMNLKEENKEGVIAREIAKIDHYKDEKGNRIVNSQIGKDVEVENSVIINSKIKFGKIKNSVIIDSIYYRAYFDSAFSIGDRVFDILANKNSGSVCSISLEPVVIPEEHRHVNVYFKNGKFRFLVHENENLRDEENLEKAIRENNISFRELYKKVSEINIDEFERLRKEAEFQVIRFIEEQN